MTRSHLHGVVILHTPWVHLPSLTLLTMTMLLTLTHMGLPQAPERPRASPILTPSQISTHKLHTRLVNAIRSKSI